MPNAFRLSLSPFALATALLLAACGGGETPGATATPTAPARASTAALLDDEGGVMPRDPAAEPTDPGAHTRARRYATESQAEQLEASMSHDLISTRVDSGPDAAGAVDLAVLVAYGLQAAHDLGRDAPVLVRGDNLRLAATAANRLQDGGFTRVFLVTP